MQHHAQSPEVTFAPATPCHSREAATDRWMPALASGPLHAKALAGQDLRMEMLAFVQGTQNNEHPCRLAARLDAIITLTREICAQPSRTRRPHGRQEGGKSGALNPAIARVLRNLDAVRTMLEGMESPQPALRHTLDPLLVAFLRGEFGSH